MVLLCTMLTWTPQGRRNGGGRGRRRDFYTRDDSRKVGPPMQPAHFCSRGHLTDYNRPTGFYTSFLFLRPQPRPQPEIAVLALRTETAFGSPHGCYCNA